MPCAIVNQAFVAEAPGFTATGCSLPHRRLPFFLPAHKLQRRPGYNIMAAVKNSNPHIAGTAPEQYAFCKFGRDQSIHQFFGSFRQIFLDSRACVFIAWIADRRAQALRNLLVLINELHIRLFNPIFRSRPPRSGQGGMA